MTHVAAENLAFAYGGAGGPDALRGVSFAVSRGATLCVAGANGCGKSTLLRLLARLIAPSRGRVRFFDGAGAENPGGRAGIVFQDVDCQLFMPTVWEDVAFGLLKDGMKIEAARPAALDALRRVEAAHLAARPPRALSGGEKQRVALAGALVTRPDLLLLDEPSAALDPRARKNLIALLRGIPCTKIIATHDLDLILDLAGDVLFLKNGEKAGASPVPGLLADETFLQETGLELPPTLRTAR